MKSRTAIVALFFCLAGSASAAPLYVHVIGTVTDVYYANPYSMPFSNPFPGLAVGDTVRASVVYDTTATYGPVSVSCCLLGYQMLGISVDGDGWRYSDATGMANFSNGSASFNLPGTSRYFPDQALAVGLQFPADYFHRLPPDYLDTSALLAGFISGMVTPYPDVTGRFAASVHTVTSSWNAVPAPGAALLFASALLGLIGAKARRFHWFAQSG